MDYSNSRKNRGDDNPKEPVVKIVTGEVTEKKKSIPYRMKEIFFAGDAKSAWNYVLAERIYPTVRDLMVKIATDYTDQLVNGRKYRASGAVRPYEARVSYNNPFGRPDPRPAPGPGPLGALMPSNYTRAIHPNTRTSNDVVFANREDAEAVLEKMMNILERYQYVSLADLNRMLGKEDKDIPFTDEKWGWKYLNTVATRQFRDGWILEMPPLEELE